MGLEVRERRPALVTEHQLFASDRHRVSEIDLCLAGCGFSPGIRRNQFRVCVGAQRDSPGAIRPQAEPDKGAGNTTWNEIGSARRYAMSSGKIGPYVAPSGRGLGGLADPIAVDVEPDTVEQLQVWEPEAAHLAASVETGSGIATVGRAESPGPVAGHHESPIREPGGFRQLSGSGGVGIDDWATSGLGGTARGAVMSSREQAAVAQAARLPREVRCTISLSVETACAQRSARGGKMMRSAH
jgi:hypothetical protein